MKHGAFLRRIEILWFAVGVLALAYVAYVVIDERAYQASEHRKLEQRRFEQPQLGDRTLPSGAFVPRLVDGDSIG